MRLGGRAVTITPGTIDKLRVVLQYKHGVGPMDARRIFAPFKVLALAGTLGLGQLASDLRANSEVTPAAVDSVIHAAYFFANATAHKAKWRREFRKHNHSS